MRKSLLTAVLLGCAAVAGAQTFNEWRDPNVNAVNRLPMHANYFAYESAAKAEQGEKEQS